MGVLPFALAPSKFISWTVTARDRHIYIPLPLDFDNYQKTEVMDTLLFHGVRCWLLKTAHGLVVASAHQERDFLTQTASDQVGLPAELKHINKRRKRN